MRFFHFKKSLKCIKCTTDNIISANYCKNCGYHFSKGEQKAAKRWTLVWFLEGIDTIKGIPKFGFITGSKIYKVGSIVFILLVGLYFFMTKGVHLKLEESPFYQIDYHTELSEYYLYTEQDQIELHLYVPNRAKHVSVQYMDENNQVLDTFSWDEKQSIVLSSQGKGDYYLLEASYDHNNIDQMKLYVFKEVAPNEK